MSLGQGLGKVAGKIFRIGHLGYFNDLMLCGTLAGVEMGLEARRRSASRRAASTPRWLIWRKHRLRSWHKAA